MNYREPVTADWLNLNLRDRMEALHSPPSATVHADPSGQSIPDDTATSVVFTGASWDSDGFWSAGQPTRLTIPTGLGGKYIFGAKGAWEAKITGYREVALRVNGGTATPIDTQAASGTSIPTRQSPVWFYDLDAGDYVEMRVRHNRGSSLLLGASSQLYLRRLSA